MTPIDTIVIGAGQAGLSASRCLTDRGVDHVVLERGRIAERWRSERWDSLRLLTPNWMSRLPGWSYSGPDPDGYMTAAEVTEYFQAYANTSSAPVLEDRPVQRLRDCGDHFEVASRDDRWQATNVIVATGWCDVPWKPPTAAHLAADIEQVSPSSYRNPRELRPGGVLVVGASATGVQLADELAEAGRHVVLATGSHSRLPRTYRGMDIFWWLERIGSLDRTIDDVPDAVAARHEPAVQLVGRPDHRDLDLSTLQAKGVRLAGRVTEIDGARVGFGPDLRRTVDDAERRMRRVLTDIDQHIADSGLAAEVLDPEPPRSLRLRRPPRALDLRARGIRTVIWATGHRRTYPWLRVPVLDDRGEIVQRQGVTPVPGLYVLGQRFQHFRRSSFIDGVGRDAAFVTEHIARRAARASRT